MNHTTSLPIDGGARRIVLRYDTKRENPLISISGDLADLTAKDARRIARDLVYMAEDLEREASL